MSTRRRHPASAGLGGYLKPASFLGRLCFGPNRGQLVQFTHPATWLPTPPEEQDPDRALAAIVRRFLSAYGPASAADLAGWWGVNRRRANQLLAAARDDVSEVSVDGEPYRMQGWVSPVLLVDGAIAGMWKHQRSGRRLRVEVTPFRGLPRRTHRLLEVEAERLAHYTGGELSLSVSE